MKFETLHLALVISLFAPVMAAQSVDAAKPNVKERSYYEARGEVVWEVQTDKKWIALTFDDGPDPQDTPVILDLLKQYQAKATFFVIGKQVKKHPEIVKREVSEGHELANHSFDHRVHFGISEKKMRMQLSEAERVILEVSGQTTHLFRPPLGIYNESIVKVAREQGYTVIMWTWHQDSRDWSKPGVNKIVNIVVSNAHPGDIVLFHDRVSGKSQTIEALKQILPRLQKRGYQFVTISELLKAKSY